MRTSRSSSSADDASSEIGPEQVRARYGIDPSQVPDFIALRGDPSDGLPGAPGIGAKTAAELLRRHGSLWDLLKDALGGHSAERPRVVRPSPRRQAAAHLQGDRHAGGDGGQRRAIARSIQQRRDPRSNPRHDRARRPTRAAWQTRTPPSPTRGRSRALNLKAWPLGSELDGDHVPSCIVCPGPPNAACRVRARQRSHRRPPAHASRSLPRGRSPSGCRCGSRRPHAMRSGPDRRCHDWAGFASPAVKNAIRDSSSKASLTTS